MNVVLQTASLGYEALVDLTSVYHGGLCYAAGWALTINRVRQYVDRPAKWDKLPVICNTLDEMDDGDELRYLQADCLIENAERFFAAGVCEGNDIGLVRGNCGAMYMVNSAPLRAALGAAQSHYQEFLPFEEHGAIRIAMREGGVAVTELDAAYNAFVGVYPRQSVILRGWHGVPLVYQHLEMQKRLGELNPVIIED